MTCHQKSRDPQEKIWKLIWIIFHYLHHLLTVETFFFFFYFPQSTERRKDLEVHAKGDCHVTWWVFSSPFHLYQIPTNTFVYYSLYRIVIIECQHAYHNEQSPMTGFNLFVHFFHWQKMGDFCHDLPAYHTRFTILCFFHIRMCPHNIE